MRERVDLSEFDPNKTDYTSKDLEKYADALLRKQAKESLPINVYPQILFREHMELRYRREIQVASGVPDPELTAASSNDGQTIYNRTHPHGRRVNSEIARKTQGASFYR